MGGESPPPPCLMKLLPNFNFNSITNVSDALQKINDQVRLLVDYVSEIDSLEEEDRSVFVENIDWLKRFYETAESRILDGD
jgi:hypothetical protein